MGPGRPLTVHRTPHHRGRGSLRLGVRCQLLGHHQAAYRRLVAALQHHPPVSVLGAHKRRPPGRPAPGHQAQQAPLLQTPQPPLHRPHTATHQLRDPVVHHPRRARDPINPVTQAPSHPHHHRHLRLPQPVGLRHLTHRLQPHRHPGRQHAPLRHRGGHQQPRPLHRHRRPPPLTNRRIRHETDGNRPTRQRISRIRNLRFPCHCCGSCVHQLLSSHSSRSAFRRTPPRPPTNRVQTS